LAGADHVTVIRRVSVTVKSDGVVQAHRRWDNAHSPPGRVAYTGLDAEVIRLFERWLTLRDRTWRAEEIRVFGSLLHRCLFPERVWSWLEAVIDREAEHPIELELIFPAEPPYSRLAAIPWEYVYQPARPGRSGRFLATDPHVLVSRYLQLEAGEPELPAIRDFRVLIVVSRPKDPRLGPVEYEDVVAGIEEWAADRGFTATVLHDPSAVQLSSALTGRDGDPPHLVHFIGHGSFDPDRGQANLALVDPAGGTDWVPDQNIAELFGRDGVAPRVVVLHCCEGGRVDFDASFAGVAPQLARAGVAAVVAMQYAVTNETATAFSRSLYQQLAAHGDLRIAVREARWEIGRLGVDRDTRLVGVPVLYLQNGSALAGLVAPLDGGESS
jgi:hypothetical protein